MHLYRQIAVSLVNDGIRKAKRKLLKGKGAGNPASCSSKTAHSIKAKDWE
jgi:hypothetical protein